MGFSSMSSTNTVTLADTFTAGDVFFTGGYGGPPGSLACYFNGSGAITNSFATGNVTGSTTGADGEALAVSERGRIEVLLRQPRSSEQSGLSRIFGGRSYYEAMRSSPATAPGW